MEPSLYFIMFFKVGTVQKEDHGTVLQFLPALEATRSLESSTAIPLNYVQLHFYFKLFLSLSIKA
jgi:hypothetical protein